MLFALIVMGVFYLLGSIISGKILQKPLGWGWSIAVAVIVLIVSTVTLSGISNLESNSVSRTSAMIAGAILFGLRSTIFLEIKDKS